MIKTFFLFNISDVIEKLDPKSKKKLFDAVVEELKKKISGKEIIGKIDYSSIKIKYFMEKAIESEKKMERVDEIPEYKFRIFSLLQRELLFHDLMISKFVNFLIRDGKKFLAYKNFELAISFLKHLMHKHPLFFLRDLFYKYEQFFDYKKIISKRTKKVIFIIPKFVEGIDRWLKPLKIWINEFFQDQSFLYKYSFFRKYYLRIAFTLLRINKKHFFLARDIINEKNIVVTQNHKRIYNIFENKNKRLSRYNRRDNNTKWNWTIGRQWKNLKIPASLSYDQTDIWVNRLYEIDQIDVGNHGAIKTKPRKLKKRHVISSFPWFGK